MYHGLRESKETVVHLPSIGTLPAPLRLACSGPAPLRHPESIVYRCFLPDLAGFTGLCRAGPNHQHRPTRSCPDNARPRAGIQPR